MVPDRPRTDLVTFHQQDDGWWTAVDEATGVASQAETRASALANLAEALELRRRALASDSRPQEPDVPWFSNDSVDG